MSTDTTNTPPPAEDSNPIPRERQGDNVRASWRFSLDAIRPNIAHYSPHAKDLMIWCFTWCIDHKHPVHFDDFAARLNSLGGGKRIGAAPNTLWKLYNGTHKHPTTGARMEPSPELIKAMETFRKLEEERFKLGRVQFVMTPTAKLIHDGCKLAQESQTPVFIWGPSHIGKTWALHHFSEMNNHGRSPYVRMRAASGLGGMLEAIARAIGVSARTARSQLLERIKRALSQDMLLIIDELHLLMYTYRKESFFACLEVIREIYDEVGCGMILCGTNLAREKIEASRNNELEQIARRGVHRIQLPQGPTAGDIRAILEQGYELKMPRRKDSVKVHIGGQTIEERPYDILRQLSAREGLKAITERLRYARRIADNQAGPLGLEHFVHAHLLIMSEDAPASDWV